MEIPGGGGANGAPAGGIGIGGGGGLVGTPPMPVKEPIWDESYMEEDGGAGGAG